MNQDRTLILVGMMGVGKTTLGQLLANQLQRPFQDTDRILVSKLGRGIPQIFSIYGEKAFRDHETALLRSLEPSPVVLATGGGIVLREENWVEMRRLGTTLFLDLSADILIARLAESRKRRPLLETDDPGTRIRELLEQRRPSYERADVHVRMVEEAPEAAVDRILHALAEHEAKNLA